MSNCPTETMVQPFATPWVDTDSNFLAPGGSFESSLTGWTPSICVTTQNAGPADLRPEHRLGRRDPIKSQKHK